MLTNHDNLASLIRTSTLLTITCCYVMWAIVYLAQLHPVISACRKRQGRGSL